MADGPVQIVLNPQSFREARRTPQGGGAGKDFYKGHNDEFVAHQSSLLDALAGILQRRSERERVNVTVQMRPDALAKSHRPFRSLFTPRRASHVGTGNYGELIFALSPVALAEVMGQVQRAETEVMWRTNARGVSVYSPSPARSESSAIEHIREWSPSDARGYSLDDAVAWLSQDTSGKLVVDLLDLPNQGEMREASAREVLRLAAVARSRPNLVRLDSASPTTRVLVEASPQPELRLKPPAGRILRSENLIRESIRLFETSEAVKRVRLQDIIEPNDGTVTSSSEDAQLPVPSLGSVDRAVVGVIDGGVAGPFANSSHYVVGRAGLVAAEHRGLDQVNHGTRIASLVALGSAVNPGLLPPSEDCRVYDLDLFPGRAYRDLYYASLDDFLDEVRASVDRAKSETGARVFNLSYNLRRAPGGSPYSLAAEGLDQIAVDLDVVFVISAGNLSAIEEREEWPPRTEDALAMLARVQVDDGMRPPAESITNVTVASVNPPGMLLGIEGAPTRYSRRGTMVPSAQKPDFAAVGGGTPSSGRETSGLRAVDSFGQPGDVQGTSFAAPLVSRYLATLDATIASDVSRELLIALAAHSAAIPTALDDRRLRSISSSFVGRGVLPSVEETLDGTPHRISIVLSDTILPGRCVEFPFTWPPSLVTPEGACRGNVRLTLATQPAIANVHGWERVRVNLDGAIKQANANGTFNSKAEATHQFFSGFTYANERSLSTELGKWFPLKSYGRSIQRGIGESADWRLDVNYLTRAGEAIPTRGIAFAAVLTIEDPDGMAPVFDEMRASLTSIGVSLSDLRTAIRVGVNT